MLTTQLVRRVLHVQVPELLLDLQLAEPSEGTLREENMHLRVFMIRVEVLVTLHRTSRRITTFH